MMKKVCKCGHEKQHHRRGECMLPNCLCMKFRNATKIPGVRQKYCQGTPPPNYAPSPEPEPLRW